MYLPLLIKFSIYLEIMKNYIKLFLLLFVFTTVHATELPMESIDNTSIEIEIKTKSIDTEEKNKNSNIDLIITNHTVYVTLLITKVVFLPSEMQSNTYLDIPFKPPRA